MLKQVSLPDLELGMFVHKMEGSWFDHPFWKAKFLLDDEEKLLVLKSSKIQGVIIDTERGKDVTPPDGRRAPSEPFPPKRKRQVKAIRNRQSINQERFKPTSTAEEVRTSEALIENATSKLQKTVLAARLGKALNVRTVEPVIRDIHASIRRNSQAFSGLMRCKLHNEFVYRHSLSVSALMVSLARKMKFSDKEVFDAGLAGLFLDIGTNYLPPNLAPADGDYSRLEPKIWQQHVVLGYRALQNDDTLPSSVLDTCMEHHERFDGSGFPKGLKGEEICVGARMAAICDTFDFLLTDAGGEKAIDPGAAIARLTEMEGAFDPEILRKFIESVGQYPVGSFVRLRSERLAMVVDENPRDPARPVVEVFYSLKENKRKAQQRSDLSQSLDEDGIVDLADLSGLDLPDEATLREMIFLAAHRG